IFDNLEVGIWSYDIKKDKYVLISKGIEGISGYSPSAFNNKLSWDSLIHPDDFSTFQERHLNIQKGQNFNFQYRIVHRNGEIVWVQERVLPVFGSDNSIIRYDGIVSN